MATVSENFQVYQCCVCKRATHNFGGVEHEWMLEHQFQRELADTHAIRLALCVYCVTLLPRMKSRERCQACKRVRYQYDGTWSIWLYAKPLADLKFQEVQCEFCEPRQRPANPHAVNAHDFCAGL